MLKKETIIELQTISFDNKNVNVIRTKIRNN